MKYLKQVRFTVECVIDRYRSRNTCNICIILPIVDIWNQPYYIQIEIVVNLLESSVTTKYENLKKIKINK